MGLSEDEVRAVHVGGEPRSGRRVVLVGHDPAWPGLFGREAARVRAARRTRWRRHKDEVVADILSRA